MVFYRNNYDNILIILTPSMVTLLVYDKYHIPRHGRATRWESLLNSYTTQRIHWELDMDLVIVALFYLFFYTKSFASISLFIAIPRRFLRLNFVHLTVPIMILTPMFGTCVFQKLIQFFCSTFLKSG
jgi:hypothetical protein